MLKKALCLLLAFMMTFSMSITALATDLEMGFALPEAIPADEAAKEAAAPEEELTLNATETQPEAIQPTAVADSDVARIGDTGYATLADAVAAAESGDVIYLLKNTEFSATVTVTKKITITAESAVTATKTGTAAWLTINANGDVTLEGPVTVAGTNKYGALIEVASKGILTMNDGVTLKDNETGKTTTGGAVNIKDGTFIMNGGTISNCKTTNSSKPGTSNGGGIGGAVRVSLTGSSTVNANFTMNGGTITGCSAYAGGAVGVENLKNSKKCTASFVMNGGTIEECSETGGNNGGAAVLLWNIFPTSNKTIEGATFTMNGGKIINNTGKKYGVINPGYNGLTSATAAGHIYILGGEISGNFVGTGSNNSPSSFFGNGIHLANIYSGAALLTIGGDAKIDDEIFIKNASGNYFEVLDNFTGYAKIFSQTGGNEGTHGTLVAKAVSSTGVASTATAEIAGKLIPVYSFLTNQSSGERYEHPNCGVVVGTNTNEYVLGEKAPAAPAAPEAPNYKNTSDTIFDIRCILDNYRIGYSVNAVSVEYCSVEVYKENGEYFSIVKVKLRECWENAEKAFWDGASGHAEHTPVEELPELIEVKLKWNEETQKWDHVDELKVFDITCKKAPEKPGVAEVTNVINLRCIDSEEDSHSTSWPWDDDYCTAGEPYENDEGKWACDVTIQVKALAELVFEQIYKDSGVIHTSVDELPESDVKTFIWNEEYEFWNIDYSAYTITCKKPTVAKLESTGAEYETLQAAIDAAAALMVDAENAKQTITLLDNVTESVKISWVTGSATKNDFDLTIDLNGKTVTGNGGSVFDIARAGSGATNYALRVTFNDSVGTAVVTGGSNTNGGAIYNSNAKGKVEIVVNGGLWTKNNATSAGGVISSNYTTSTNVIINGGVFTGNTAGTNGGAINARNLKMTGGEIYGNTAKSGGGVYVFTNATTTLEMTGGKIYGNTATTDGDDIIWRANKGNTSTAYLKLISAESMGVENVNAWCNDGSDARYDAENPDVFEDYAKYTTLNTRVALKAGYVAPFVPELPANNGSNVTSELITIVCDTDDGHTAKTYGWADPAANIVFPAGSEPVFDEELDKWTISVRIDSIQAYYVGLRFNDTCNGIQHEVVMKDPITSDEYKRIDTKLVWNEADEKWDTPTGEPFEVHVTCQTAPEAPQMGFHLGKFQVKVVGNVKGEEKVWHETLHAETVTVGEVKGNRVDGFTVDVTVALADGDEYISAWAAKHGEENVTYTYDWTKTNATATFTLKYTGDTTGEIYDGPEYWAANGDKVYTAYVADNAPAAPEKLGGNVTPDLVRVICDSDENHAPINIKWQHQSTKVYPGAKVEWDNELNTWKVKVRIDGVAGYYVWLNFDKVYDNIEHTMVDEDQKVIDTYLKWDAEKELWVTLDEKPIDVHVCCKTLPDYPAKLGSYQIQVKGDIDGDGIYGENGLTNESGVYELFTTTIPEDGYTFSEIYGNRKDGFFIDVTVTLENNDIYITNWINNRDPGKNYVYNWDMTEQTVVFTLKYNRGTTGNLYGEGSNDWVWTGNNDIYGQVAEAYVEQVKETVRLVIYRNGNTQTPYETIYLGKVAKGEVIDLTEIDIADYYTGTGDYKFEGWFNDGRWNQYKAGKNPEGLETITVNGFTNINCMVTDYERVVVKAVINGDKDNAETIFTGKALMGENTVEWLNANVDVEEITGHTADKWYNWDWYGHKVPEDATINGWTNVYVLYSANEYTLTLDPNGGKVDPATVTVTYKEAIGELPEATKTSYVFNGWVDAEGNEVTAETIYTLTEDSTITAQWIPVPAVSYVTNELFTIQCTEKHEHSWLCNWFGSHVSLVKDSVKYNEETGRWEAQVKIGSSMMSQINSTQPKKNYFGGMTHHYDETNYVFDVYYDPDFTGLNSAKKEVTGMWLPAEEYVVPVYCYTAPAAPDVSEITGTAVWVRDVANKNSTHSVKVTVKNLAEGSYTLGEVYTENGKFYADLTVTNVAPLLETLGAKTGKTYVVGNWELHNTAEDLKFVLEYTGSTTDYKQDGSGWTISANSWANNTEKLNGKSLWVTEQFTVTYNDGAEGKVFAEEIHTVYAYYENGKTANAVTDFEATETPVREDPSRAGYVFNGWEPEVAETVTENVTYVAQWIQNPGSSSTNVTKELFTIECTENHDHSWLCNWFGSHVTLVKDSVKYNEETGRWEAQAKTEKTMFSAVNNSVTNKNYFGGITHYYDETAYVIDMYYDPDFTGLNSQGKEVTGMWLPAKDYVFPVYCYTEPAAPDIAKITTTAIWVKDADAAFKNQTYSTKYTIAKLIEGTYKVGDMYEKNGKFYADLTITDLSAYVSALSAKNGKNYVVVDWAKHNTMEDFKFVLTYTGSTTDYKQDGTGWSVDASSWANNTEKVNGKNLWVTEQFTVVYNDGLEGNVFAEESYTVYAFSENGGTANNWNDFSATETPVFAGSTEREGYTFLGWEPAVAETVTGNATYVAQWQANEYTVSFNTNGGEAKESIVVTYDAKYGTALNSAPSVTGFSGGKNNWYLVDENGNVTDINIKSATVVSTARDHELFLKRAVLAPTLKITLEVPGAISNDYKYYVPGNSTRVLTVTVNNANTEELVYSYQWYKDGVAIDGATEAVLTLEGNVSDSGTYKVEVTATLKDGSKIVVTDNSATGTKEQKVQIMRATNTLRLNENYGENKTSDNYWGGAVATIRSAAARTGYTFLGWNTAADGSGEMYQAGDSVEFPNDNGNGGIVLELFAQWQANEYTVSFNTNGGEAKESIVVTYDAKYGTALNSAPSVTGFSGGKNNWYLVDENGNVTDINIKSATVVSTARDHELFLKRAVLAPTLKITLEVPGAISNDYKYYVPGNSTRVLTVTVNNANTEELVYSYQWYKDGVAIDGATEAVLTLEGNVSDSGTYKVEVTATLKDGSKIVVTDNSATGTKEQKVQIMRATNTLRLNENYGENKTSDNYWGGAVATIRSAAAARTGYTFLGWNTAADGSGEMYQAGDSVEFPNDNGNGGIVLELFAQWQANEYTISLDPNGGEVDPDEVVVNYDSEIGELPEATRTGYTFLGWFDAQGNKVTEETVYTIADDITLTAEWEINVYKVTYNKNGGYCSEEYRMVTYNHKVGKLPEARFIDGYVFSGWYDKDGNKVDENYVITEDTILTARWAFVITVGGNSSTIIGNITEGEENPNTGAEVPAVSAVMAIAVIGGAVVVLGKRK